MAQESPLISVIIPVHNSETYLEACLKSVRDQTYQNLEIILINDGSTDRSAMICQQQAKLDARITVINQANAGQASARNAGLDAMHGAWLTFVDADDKIAPTMIAELYQAAKATASELAICSFREVWPDRPPRTFWPITSQAQTLTPDQAIVGLLLEHGYTMAPWGKLYQARLFRNVRFPSGKIYEDVGTIYRTFLRAERVAFVAKPLYSYFQNPSSTIHRGYDVRSLDLITLTDRMAQDILAWSDAPDVQNAVKLRRMHARFSVLRLMVMSKTHDSEMLTTRQEIVQYLHRHKADVLKNPLRSRRDVLAMYSLLLGLPIFKLAWQIYQRH